MASDPFDDERRVDLKRKYPCASCGGEAVWDPARHALACPYCGTVAAFDPPEAEAGILEHDLESTLAALRDQPHGWDAKKRAVRCESCDAITVFDPERVAQRCDFCGSPAIIPIEEQDAPIRPESLLPFRISETEVRESIRKWYATRWFAPNRLKKAALTDLLHGLYVPYWTFDAQVHAEWSALAGYYQYTRMSDGRVVRTVRWAPASGRLDHFFDDELVSGSKGLNPTLLRGIEPFPTMTDLRPYSPGYVSGWVVERYQVDLAAAATASEESIRRQTWAMCSQQVPGDTQQQLQVDARFSGRTFKHALMPVWLLTYNYGSKVYRVALNGYTGRIYGAHPYSWIKIMLAVMAAAIALYFLMELGNR